MGNFDSAIQVSAVAISTGDISSQVYLGCVSARHVDKLDVGPEMNLTDV